MAAIVGPSRELAEQARLADPGLTHQLDGLRRTALEPGKRGFEHV
jgi:hypothetical protein